MKYDSTYKKEIIDSNSAQLKAVYKAYKTKRNVTPADLSMARGTAIPGIADANAVGYPGAFDYAIPAVYGAKIMRLAEPKTVYAQFAESTDASLVGRPGDRVVRQNKLWFDDRAINQFAQKNGFTGNEGGPSSEDTYGKDSSAKYSYGEIVAIPKFYFLATTWTEQDLEDFDPSLQASLTELIMERYVKFTEIATIAALAEPGVDALTSPWFMECTDDYDVAPADPTPFTQTVAALGEQFPNVLEESRVSVKALMNANTFLEELGFEADTGIILSIRQVAQLWADPNVKDFDKRGNTDPLVRGVIGQIAGLNVLKSRYNNAGFREGTSTTTTVGTFPRIATSTDDTTFVAGQVAFMFDSKRAFFYAWKRFLKLEMVYKPEFETHYLATSLRWAVKRIDPKSIVMLISGSKQT